MKQACAALGVDPSILLTLTDEQIRELIEAFEEVLYWDERAREEEEGQ